METLTCACGYTDETPWGSLCVSCREEKQPKKEKRFLPYDYARCYAVDCDKEGTCLRKTPGHPNYQSVIMPKTTIDCQLYISE